MNCHIYPADRASKSGSLAWLSALWGKAGGHYSFAFDASIFCFQSGSGRAELHSSATESFLRIGDNLREKIQTVCAADEIIALQKLGEIGRVNIVNHGGINIADSDIVKTDLAVSSLKRLAER